MISHVAGEPTFWEEGGREEGTASSGVNLAFLPHAWYLVSIYLEGSYHGNYEYGYYELWGGQNRKCPSVRTQIAAYANVSCLGQFNKYPHI